MGTITYSTTLTTLSCGECGIPFAMPSETHRSHLQQGSWFWCPNGHRIHFYEPENTRLKAQLDQAKADAEWQAKQRARALAQAEHERRRANGMKGAMVKAKKRAARGVCPAPGCKRSFVDVARHVATCHPGLDGGEA